MKQVASATDPLHATLLIGVLEDHGIEAIVQGEALWAARGELPLTPESAPSIWVVHDEDALIAADLLAGNEGRVDPKQCAKCGYDLRGLISPRCPECGTPFRISGDWTCADCGEKSPTHFSHCWSCGAAQEVGTITEPNVHRAITYEDKENLEQPDPNCRMCQGTGLKKNLIIPTFCIAGGSLLAIAVIQNVFSASSRSLTPGLLVRSVFFFAFAWVFLVLGFRWRKLKCRCCEEK